MNRRDFFLLRPAGPSGRPGGRTIELSCEQLWIKYLDANMNGAVAQLFERLNHELGDAGELRLVDTSWLSRDDFRLQLDRVLDAFRSRGGRVVVE